MMRDWEDFLTALVIGLTVLGLTITIAVSAVTGSRHADEKRTRVNVAKVEACESLDNDAAVTACVLAL